MIYSALICLVLISVQSSSSTFVKSAKIAPVKLWHECAHLIGGIRNKTPILLLHGLTGSVENWDGTFENLVYESGREVCRADLRNHGNSDWSEETSVAAMTEDVIQLLDDMGTETAVIIGHSLGGKVAIHTALNYPERVDSIVVEDMSPNDISHDMQMNITFLLKVLKMGMEKLPEEIHDETEAKEIVFGFLTDLVKEYDVVIAEENLDEIVPLTCSGGKCRWKMNVDAFLDTIEKGFDVFWTRSYGKYESPSLFMYGTKSPFKVYEHEDNIQELFPNAKLVAVEGADHQIHAIFPQFEEEIFKFLNKTENAL